MLVRLSGWMLGLVVSWAAVASAADIESTCLGTAEPRTVVVRPLPAGRSEYAASIACVDSGFVIAGYASTAGGDVPLLLRVDGLGIEQWRRTLPGGGDGAFWSARPLEDGSIVAVGWARGPAGDRDALVARFSANGDSLWSRTYPGPDNDRLWSVTVLGKELLAAGESVVEGGSRSRALVLNVDLQGTPLTMRSFGADSAVRVFSIESFADGGYVLVGQSGHGPRESSGYDAVIARFDAKGAVVWSRKWGGAGYDVAHDVHALPDGGLIVTGYGFAGDAPSGDAFLMRLTAKGAIEWTHRYGGTCDDRAVHVATLADGGFAMIGYTRDGAGDVDCVVRRTDAQGQPLWEQAIGGVAPELGRGIVRATNGDIVAVGHSRSFGPQERIVFMRAAP